MDRRTVLHTGLASSATKARTAPRSYVVQLIGQASGGVKLGARPLVVGAAEGCDIIVTDPKVSRRHLELSMTAEGVRLRDLGSTNGTFYQGTRVADVLLAKGALVQLGSAQLKVAPADAPSLPPSEKRAFGAMVGSSYAMRELFAILELAAPTDATVLIEGESGTGKELAARAIHDASPRARGPFVVVDCSAISENLVESHLFGHVKGAFTGAERERKGAFVEASGGTLFLDELGELPLAAQARLLRVLEAQTVQPVGADRPVAVDTRVIAATHRDLEKLVAAGQFRFDLFYRLAVVHVALPPLRERLDDLPELVAALVRAKGRVGGAIEGDNLGKLRGHAWPGNVRELRNVLDRAMALSPPGASFAGLRLWVEATASAAPATPTIDLGIPFKEAKEAWNDEFEKAYVAGQYAAHGQNVTRAAAQAGVSRRHFRELLYKHAVLARPLDDVPEDE